MRLVDEVDSELKPYFHGLYLCFQKAWELWMEMATVLPYQFEAIKSRARANILYDLIRKVVIERYGADADVVLREERGFLLMVIQDKFVLRFKKLDRNGLTCKGHTPQYHAYFSHQLPLPGMPPEAVRLVAGYQLDPAQASLKDVLVTLQWDRQLVWFASIQDVAIELGQKSAPALAPVAPTSKKNRVKATVIPKRPDRKQEKDSTPPPSRNEAT